MRWIARTGLLLLVGLVVFGACNRADEAEPTSFVVSSDADLRAIAEELLPDLAQRAGLALVAPIRVERRSRAELEGYLRAKLDEELPPDEEVYLTRAYHLLGLVPEDLQLRELLLSVYTEQVAGFYDPDSTALFVLDDQPAASLTTLLVHELVHAVQDQAVDLDSITSKERGNDRQAAAQAAIEGHATLVMLEFISEQAQGSPVDLSEIQDFSGQIRPTLESVRGQYPVLSSAPRVIQESLLFPYIEGAGYVQALWRSRDGRPAPFGELLPQSTEQILTPGKGTSADLDNPVDFVLRPTSAELLFADQLGAFETSVFLNELIGSGAGQLAEGWGGDHFVLVEAEGGERGITWVTVWDGLEQRDAFVASVGERLGGLPEPGTVTAVDVLGMPGALLRVGWAGEVEIESVVR